MNRLFSICIPTYNRVQCLKEAIWSVLSQVNESNMHDIEIVIADNASDDSTEEYVTSIIKTSKIPIKYEKNRTNVGCDANFLKVVTMATGTFCLILGDDDKIAGRSFDVVLNELKANGFIDIFLFGHNEYNSDFSAKQEHLPELNDKQNTIYDFKEVGIDKYIQNANNLIAAFNCLSVVVFKREKWQSILNKEKYIGTGYVHVYPFMKILWGENKGILKHITTNVFDLRLANDRFILANGIYDRLKMEVVYLHEIAKSVISDKKILRVYDNLTIRSDGFSWAVKAKIGDGFGFYLKDLPLLMRHYWTFPLFWLKIFPILFVPASLLKAVRYFYRNIIKKLVIRWRLTNNAS